MRYNVVGQDREAEFALPSCSIQMWEEGIRAEPPRDGV